jgi:predicted DNA-binding protein
MLFSKDSVARILVVIPDELEKRLRQHIHSRYKGKTQSFLSYTVTEALERYLQEEERKDRP